MEGFESRTEARLDAAVRQILEGMPAAARAPAARRGRVRRRRLSRDRGVFFVEGSGNIIVIAAPERRRDAQYRPLRSMALLTWLLALIFGLMIVWTVEARLIKPSVATSASVSDCSNHVTHRHSGFHCSKRP